MCFPPNTFSFISQYLNYGDQQPFKRGVTEKPKE